MSASRAAPAQAARDERDAWLAPLDLDRSPFTIAWELTRACAYACVHCRADAQPKRDPRELDRATREPKHQMALVFRWYLGMTSRWARVGDDDRKRDFQMWCGPAMGAFNQWVKGSPLEPTSGRTVVQVALNLLEGAATIGRAQQLRCYGVDVPSEAFQFVPRTMRA